MLNQVVISQKISGIEKRLLRALIPKAIKKKTFTQRNKMADELRFGFVGFTVC
jgi:hypothetical protein